MKVNVLDYQGVLLPGDKVYNGFFVCPCCSNTIRYVLEIDEFSSVIPLVFVCKLNIEEKAEHDK